MQVRTWRGAMPMVLAAALVSACTAAPPPRTSFPVMRFDYLTPVRLNVASVDIQDATGQPVPPNLPASATPIEALRHMAEDRLVGGGSAGQARFVIDQASVTPTGRGLAGTMAVHLEVLTPGGDRSGYAEARVNRVFTGSTPDLRGATYDLVSQMMTDMNVEFEYQVRQSLRDWLQETAPSAPAPAAVEQEDLGAPGGTARRPTVTNP